MKRTRFVQRTVSCILAAAMIATLASCGVPSGSIGGAGETNQPKQIVNYYTSEMYTKPSDLGYVQNAFAKDGFIYLYGYKDSSSAETISMFYNLESGQTTDFSIDMLDAEYINNVEFFGDKTLVAYQKKDTYETMMALVTASGEVLADVDVRNSYAIATSMDADGNIVTVNEDYNGNGSRIIKRVYDASTLKEISSEDYTEKLNLGRNAYPSNVVFDDDGTAYISVMEYDDSYENVEFRLIKLNPDGTVAYETSDLSGMGEATGGGIIFKRQNGNLCLMAADDKDNFFFDEIDAATGNVTKMYEADIDARKISGITYGVEGIEGADVLYSDETGLYKINVESGKSEKILTFGEEVPANCKDCYNLQVRNGSVYFYGQSYSDGSSTGLYKMDSDGNIIESINISSDDDSYVRNVFVNSAGEMSLLKNAYDDEEEKEVYKVVTLNDDGTEKSSVDISAAVENRNSYINQVYAAGDDLVAAVESYDDSSNENQVSLIVFGTDGNVKNTVKLDSKEINYIEKFVHSMSGDYIFYYGNKSGSSCAKVDLETGEVSETDFDIPMYANAMESDGNYDFCYQTQEGIYGFSVAENKSTEILNYVDSDISFNVQNAFFYDENTILALGYDYEIGDYQVYFLKRADEETLKKIQNKTIVTVAGVDLSYGSIREKVVDFNRNSDEYRVQINDYGKFSKYDENDTYVSGAFQLNNDMSSGNIPDIIVGDGDVDMTSFAAKKIITDLNPFIEKDEDINKEDYFENVLDALSYGGKLCQITSDFTLSTICGPKSKLGDSMEWTTEEFLGLKDKGRIFWEREDRDYLLRALITTNLTEFVDFENKTCDFDNERVAGLIDLIAEEGYVYDEEISKFEDEEDDSKLHSRRYADGKCQADFINIGSFYELLELQQGAAGEEVTIKGLPSEKGNGILVVPNTSFAICEKSKNKDAAWQFIRTFIGEEYQNSLVEDDYSYRIPLMKSAYDVMINKAISNQNNPYGQIEKPDGSYEDMKPIDQNTADKVKKAVESASRCVASDERIGKIIEEAAEKVFNDEISSAEAAAEIQSKVKTYLNEIK